METNKIWVSDKSGRSFFGIKIKEEIFAICIILLILSLSNDEKIKNVVDNNIYIQGFIIVSIIYCIYNRLPWSLIFTILFVIHLLFTDFTKNVYDSVVKIFYKISSSDKKIIKKKEEGFGNKILQLVFGKKKKNVSFDLKKNKIKHYKVNEEESNEEESGEEESDEEESDEICKKASTFFNFSDDESDGEDIDNIKNNLKSFMMNNISEKE